MTAVERIVLVDDAGNATGTAPKHASHHRDTPLHLAFSCYVFDGAGRLLLTRRAQHKPTWGGVWTNSFCGHPGPGEPMEEALRRRARQELGVELHDLRLVLPMFRYEATMANGVRENELCPVFVARTTSAVRPDASEVDTADWTDWATFRDQVLAGEREVSPWCLAQVADLAAREGHDGSFASASFADLPAAARA
jgi:isopentenyl-diphosphate Delta-isomerase